MEPIELDRQIAEMREKGFDDAFARFSAATFSSYSYPPDNLAAARMHAFYLRLALEALSCGESRQELFREAQEGDRLETAFRETATESYRAALSGDRPFCEVFVEMWCSRWAYGKEA